MWPPLPFPGEGLPPGEGLAQCAGERLGHWHLTLRLGSSSSCSISDPAPHESTWGPPTRREPQSCHGHRPKQPEDGALSPTSHKQASTTRKAARSCGSAVQPERAKRSRGAACTRLQGRCVALQAWILLTPPSVGPRAGHPRPLGHSSPLVVSGSVHAFLPYPAPTRAQRGWLFSQHPGLHAQASLDFRDLASEA